MAEACLRKSKIFYGCLSVLPAETTHTPRYFWIGIYSHSTGSGWHESAVRGPRLNLQHNLSLHPQSSNMREEQIRSKEGGGREEEGERLSQNKTSSSSNNTHNLPTLCCLSVTGEVALPVTVSNLYDSLMRWVSLLQFTD